MSLLIGIEAQPGFPREDLSDQNAALLELILANDQIVSQTHISAESVSWVYRVGHPSITIAAKRLYDGPKQLDAIDRGVAMYETIASSEFNMANYAFDAYDGIKTEAPRFTAVVTESSRRHFGYDRDYAVLGAALARQFEIDIANRT